MAREGKRGRRADEGPEDAPVLEPVDGGKKDRGGKKASGGGGFPGALPAMTGVVAGVLAFAGTMVVGGQSAPKEPFESLDAGGIQAARLLAAMDLDRWKLDFGTFGGARAPVMKEIEKRKAEAKGADDEQQFTDALNAWLYGSAGSGSKWRPGFNTFFPLKDPADDQAKKMLAKAIEMVETTEPGAFIGATILGADGAPLVVHPDQTIPTAPPGGKLVRTSGATQIFDVGSWKAARWYQHPAHDRMGNAQGSVVVILSTASVKPFPLTAAAGAAGGLAFVGALIVASILAGGTKHALQQLASDADAIAKGRLDTKVSIGGPAVVQQAAKNLQRVAALAASGAAAPPQVMVQEVIRAPVQEISEALAPSKSFQRVDELEVEATQKRCTELGNDYYDVINVDDEHVGVFIADVPVRGAKSAMQMATVRALFRANAKGQTSPAEVLKAVNRGFAVDLTRGVYVTAMYAVVNRASGIAKVASAQHLPLVFWKLTKKASARLSPEGIALGLDPGPVFDKTITEKAVQLEKGDRLLMFTDGAINGRNPAGAQYGDERFYYVVNREAPKNSAACVNFIGNDVDLFHEGAPLTDDFTLVTVRRMR